MFYKLLIATVALYLCLEVTYGQHATGFNPNAGQRQYATGKISGGGGRHPTGFNQNARRYTRDLIQADHGRDFKPHATGLIHQNGEYRPANDAPHATGYNPNLKSGRHARDIQADKGRDFGPPNGRHATGFNPSTGHHATGLKPQKAVPY